MQTEMTFTLNVVIAEQKYNPESTWFGWLHRIQNIICPQVADSFFFFPFKHKIL